MQEKMLFIFNPATGNGRLKNYLMDILCMFSAGGYQLTVCPTQKKGDGRRYAIEQGASHDIVVCCGGDGTLNETMDGLLALPHMPLVGYIPGGTTCDFASSLHLPKSNMKAAAKRIVTRDKLYSCDLGVFNGKAFVYVAAFGAFTNVAYQTPQKHKNLLGHFAYLLEGVQQLPKLESYHVQIECDGQTLEDEFLLGMITNSTSVGGFTFPSPNKIKLNDGKYEVILVKRPKNLTDLGELSAAVLGGSFQSQLLTILRGGDMTLRFDRDVHWTLDGELGGAFQNADIHIRQNAFQIFV